MNDSWKKKMSIGEIRKRSACCAPSTPENQVCCAPAKEPPVAAKNAVSEVTFRERVEHIRCRISGFRSRYTVEPGLYALGAPGKDSDVFVSANYKLSFDILRESLKGMDAWVLVLDTKGINVWCAAGKGTFGTEELVKRIFESNLLNAVTHRRLIVPQLGGPGIAAHEVKKQTGFRVSYGPVYARDIKAYIASGYKASKEMRKIDFTIAERLVLTPMELLPALKKFLVYAAAVLLVTGISSSGVSFRDAFTAGGPLVAYGFVAVLSGAFFTPLLLPFIPFRSFALKGLLAGILSVFIASFFIPVPQGLKYAAWIFFPLASSYIALQFTGSTVYTGMSGVKKELRYSLPVYMTGAVTAALLVVAYKLSQWGLV